MTIPDITIALIAATSRIIIARSQQLHRLCDAQAQNRIAEPKLPDDIAKAWAKWFEEVDRLEVRTNEPDSEFKLQ